MGFLDSLFGKKQENHPPLDESSPASGQIKSVAAQIKELCGQVKDRLEVIPADQAMYIIIGEPPKRFGVAWVEGGELKIFKHLLNERGADPLTLERLSGEIGKLYESHASEPRFNYTLDSRTLVVCPSDALGGGIKSLIDAVGKQP